MELSNPKGMLNYLVRNKKVNPEVEGTSSQVAVVNKVEGTLSQEPATKEVEDTSSIMDILEENPNSVRPQEYEEVIVHPSYPKQKVKIGQSLSKEELEQLKDFFSPS